MALPLEVEQAYHELSEGKDPDVAVRALNSMAGDLGETYVLGDEHGLFLHSRQIGGDTEQISWTWNDVSAMEVADDRPFAYLDLTAADTNCRLKFSSMDKDRLDDLRQLYEPEPGASSDDETPDAAVPPGAGPPPIPTTSPVGGTEPPADSGELTPLTGFCAAVYALIQVDGNVDTDELELLNRQVGSPETVAKGLDWLRRLGAIGLLDKLKQTFDQPQKLCLIANLIEISMADGLLRGTEKRLLQQIRDALDIDANDYDAIYEIILVKNNLSVFQPN